MACPSLLYILVSGSLLFSTAIEPNPLWPHTLSCPSPTPGNRTNRKCTVSLSYLPDLVQSLSPMQVSVELQTPKANCLPNPGFPQIHHTQEVIEKCRHLFSSTYTPFLCPLLISCQSITTCPGNSNSLMFSSPSCISVSSFLDHLVISVLDCYNGFLPDTSATRLQFILDKVVSKMQIWCLSCA